VLQAAHAQGVKGTIAMRGPPACKRSSGGRDCQSGVTTAHPCEVGELVERIRQLLADPDARLAGGGPPASAGKAP
jgi:hypothetical protein